VCGENTKVLPHNLISHEFSGIKNLFISLSKEDSCSLYFPSPLSELILSHPHGTGITVYIPRFLIKLSKEIGRIKPWIKIHLAPRVAQYATSSLIWSPHRLQPRRKGLPMQTITNEKKQWIEL